MLLKLMLFVPPSSASLLPGDIPAGALCTPPLTPPLIWTDVSVGVPESRHPCNAFQVILGISFPGFWVEPLFLDLKTSSFRVYAPHPHPHPEKGCVHILP